jgi:hypothetical protein
MQNTQNEERLSSPALVAGNESTLGADAPPLPASGEAASSARVCDLCGELNMLPTGNVVEVPEGTICLKCFDIAATKSYNERVKTEALQPSYCASQLP